MPTNGREALDRKLGELRKARRRAESLAEKHASKAALLRAEEEATMERLLDVTRGTREVVEIEE